jgi:hypothetical protein
MSISKSDLEALNSDINRETPIYEQKPLNSLIIGKPYIIHSISSVNTRYGKCIVTILAEDDKGGSLFRCWLPKRLTEKMSDEVIERMNKSDVKYSLTYLGPSSVKSQNVKPKSLLNFGMLE